MSEWKKVKLGDICNFVKGEIGIAKAQAGEYPLVVTGKERKTCDFFQFDTKAVCIPLVSSAGHGKAALNYVHYQEGKFALGSILVAVIPQDENIINAQFLHLYLSRLKDLLLVPLMKGTANVSLSVALIKNIEISLPKIERQIEIVNLFNQIDLDHQELTKENTNQKNYLIKLRQAILQEAIEGKLTVVWRVNNPVCLGNPEYDAAALLKTIKTEKQKLIAEGKIKKEKPLAPINPDDVPFTLPDGWVWVRLGGVTHIFAGYSFESYDFRVSDGIKCIKITNAGVGRLVETEDYLPDLFKEKYVDFIVKKGDLIIALTRPYISEGLKISVCPMSYDNSLLNQRVAAIRNIFGINFQYAYLFMTSDIVLKGYKNKFEKVNLQPNLRMSDLTGLAIPLPPLAEQQAIVERVDRLLATVNALEQQVQARKTYAEQLMQAVLKEAFAS
jgi:type I restriction enzyme S subunit